MKEPIRVLQIIGLSCGGGVESVIMNYYRHLDKEKVQFDFIVHKEPLQSFVEEARSMGAKVYEITPYNQNIFKFTYEIFNIIKKGNYRIVHSNMNSLSGFPLLAAYLAGTQVRILHNHTTDTKEEGIRTTIKRMLRPFAKVFANQYWACSKLAGEWMYGKRAVENGRVTVINNAIDLDKFAFNQVKRDELRKEFGLEGKFVVGHVGRFMKQKNHEFLIDVFAEVIKQKENAILLLIGDGPLTRFIKDKVDKLNLTDKVIFLGVRNDVADLYNVMDVFVLTSFYEGLPVVGVECQANGLPFICSDNVTKEIVLSKAIELLSLNSSKEQWAEKAIKVGVKGRIQTRIDIEKIGFDIKVVSKTLEICYFC